jgi:hypothetical protein
MVAVVGGLALVVAACGVYVANRLASGGRTTEVGVERAVEAFRSQAASTVAGSTVAGTAAVAGSTAVAGTTTVPPAVTAAAAGVTTVAPATPSAAAAPLPGPALPAAGVYAYATTGHHAVDVLTGARRDYPAVTTITVTPSGCGVQLRWDVAAERWDTWDWCLDGAGIRLTGWTGYHEFFEVAGRSDYACTGDPRPLDAEPGTTWSMVCRVDDRDTSTYTGTVIGQTSVVVGGTVVPALHVRYDIEVVGVSTGSQTVEGWYRTTDGLPLREVLATTTEQQTVIGTTSFEERSTIELVSVTPQS